MSQMTQMSEKKIKASRTNVISGTSRGSLLPDLIEYNCVQYFSEFPAYHLVYAYTMFYLQIFY